MGYDPIGMERDELPKTVCPDCGAELPTYVRGEPHLLHTDPEYKKAWDLTDGRFQVFVFPPDPDPSVPDNETMVHTRARSLFMGKRVVVEAIVPVIQKWLDEQAAKVSVP